MSTLQSLNTAMADVQQAAALWTPHMTTGNSGNFAVTYAGTPSPQPTAKPKPPLKPLEWLDAQVSEVLELAVP